MSSRPSPPPVARSVPAFGRSTTVPRSAPTPKPGTRSAEGATTHGATPVSHPVRPVSAGTTPTVTKPAQRRTPASSTATRSSTLSSSTNSAPSLRTPAPRTTATSGRPAVGSSLNSSLRGTSRTVATANGGGPSKTHSSKPPASTSAWRPAAKPAASGGQSGPLVNATSRTPTTSPEVKASATPQEEALLKHELEVERREQQRAVEDEEEAGRLAVIKEQAKAFASHTMESDRAVRELELAEAKRKVASLQTEDDERDAVDREVEQDAVDREVEEDAVDREVEQDAVDQAETEGPVADAEEAMNGEEEKAECSTEGDATARGTDESTPQPDEAGMLEDRVVREEHTVVREVRPDGDVKVAEIDRVVTETIVVADEKAVCTVVEETRREVKEEVFASKVNQPTSDGIRRRHDGKTGADKEEADSTPLPATAVEGRRQKNAGRRGSFLAIFFLVTLLLLITVVGVGYFYAPEELAAVQSKGYEFFRILQDKAKEAANVVMDTVGAHQ